MSTLLGANLRCDEIEELMQQADLVRTWHYQMKLNIFSAKADLVRPLNCIVCLFKYFLLFIVLSEQAGLVGAWNCIQMKLNIKYNLYVHCSGWKWLAGLWRVCKNAHRRLNSTFFSTSSKTCDNDFVFGMRKGWCFVTVVFDLGNGCRQEEQIRVLVSKDQ